MKTVLFNRVVELLLLPPGMTLLLLLGALVLWRVRRLALSLLIVALATLYAASLPLRGAMADRLAGTPLSGHSRGCGANPRRRRDRRVGRRTLSGCT